MAIYYLEARIITRRHGHSALNAAAYRSREALYDEQRGRVYDHRGRPDLIYSAIKGTDLTREQLWNTVERTEKRRDARLAREIVLALPTELSQADNIALVNRFASDQFTRRGMVADLNIHWTDNNPHAHALLTTRANITGPKVREWDDRSLLLEWREQWATIQNQHLRANGFDIRVDHRTNQERGLEPAIYRGWHKGEIHEPNREYERADY